MNTKQTIPVIAKIAPPLLIGVAIFLAVKELFSSQKDTETKPETASADAEAERRRKEAETALNTPVFRPIPPEISGKTAAVPVTSAPRVVIPPPAVKINSPVPVPVAVAVPKIMAQAPPPPPIKTKFITREDMATVFHRGARPLTRTAAVAALKKLGFGKTAAYDALSADGRFASWLQFVPDGTITWTD